SGCHPLTKLFPTPFFVHPFLDCLLISFQILPSQPQSPIVLIATIRADFLGNALSYRPFADVLQNADIKLGAMNREELSQVIAKPAEKLGVSFEAGLVKRILDAVEDQPGNLPLLEFALTELWKRRTGKQLTHAGYEAIGEVQGALANYADKKYRKLSFTKQEQVQRIFIQLVYPGEKTKDTRKLATKAELGEEKWSSVKQLADARLVVTSQNATGEETVELVHEALIKEWKLLREWIESDRIFRTWQERLRVAMRQWQTRNDDEGTLLRGTLLVEAEEWLQHHPDEISKPEWEFIQSSLALRDRIKRQEEKRLEQELRQQKAKTRFVITTAFFAITALVTGGIAWQKNREAQLNQVLALAADGFPKPELLPAARYLLEKANNLHYSAKNDNEVQEALTNYRAVIVRIQVAEY
ncbi:MAG: hypothetical protein RMY63_41145, partial [Nostoc sp. ChiQUE01b]|nr:hypothetical protein [Nostoc sp. ChiQUE01b]